MFQHHLRWVTSEGEQELLLTADQVLIGRDSSSDIVIKDAYVSRYHAKLTRGSGGYRLIDLKSTHGVHVNGRRVGEHDLQPGDRFHLGKAKLEFRYVDQSASTRETDGSLGIFEPGHGSDELINASGLRKLSYVLDLRIKLDQEFSSEKTIEQILTSALQLSGAERGFILLKTDTDWDYMLGRDHDGQNLQQSEFVHASRTVVRQVATSGQPVFMTEGIDGAWAKQASIVQMNLRAVACMPLEWMAAESGQSAVRGILYLDSTKPMHALSGLDQKILSRLGLEAAGVFEKVEMIKALEERQKVQRELELARETQESLLPRRIPDLPGLQIRAFCRPTHQVGGDFYDFFERKSGELIGILADVSGKGVSAALLSSLLQGALNMQFCMEAEVAPALDEVNQFVCRRTQPNRFVTLFVFQLDEKGVGQFISAGHNPVYHWRSTTNEVIELTSGNMVLGAFETTRYDPVALELRVGDLMLVYSDGLTEAENAEGTFFGEDRLKALVTEAGRKGSEGLQTEILAALHQFTKGRPQTDDITFLIIEKS